VGKVASESATNLHSTVFVAAIAAVVVVVVVIVVVVVVNGACVIGLATPLWQQLKREGK
jgi:cell division protein FtsN